MRIINADLLFDSTFKLYRELSDKDFGKLRRWLNEFPTVENSPQAESNWIMLKNGCIRCDGCGAEFIGTKKTYDFCPICGKPHKGTISESMIKA